MSSFLTRGLNGEEIDPRDSAEEQYKRLMPKIGRDFVSIEDLQEVIQRLMLLIDPLSSDPIQVSVSHAEALAHRYKQVVEFSSKDTDSQRDLVVIE